MEEFPYFEFVFTTEEKLNFPFAVRKLLKILKVDIT